MFVVGDQLIVCLFVCILFQTSLTNDVSCPVDSHVGKNITGLKQIVKDQNNENLYIVQSSSHVSVQCWSLLPNRTVSLKLDSESDLIKRSGMMEVNQTVWRKSELDMFSSKTVTCSLSGQSDETCKTKFTLVNKNKDTNCTASSNNVTCNILEWDREARKAKTKDCPTKGINPGLDFYMYLSFNQSWTKCDKTKTKETEDKEMGFEYQSINCQFDQLIIRDDETILLQLRRTCKSGGFYPKNDVDESTYLSISGSNLTININTEGIGFATTEMIIVIASVFFFLILFCIIFGMKRKQPKLPFINQTKHSQTFIKEDRSSSVSSGQSDHTISMYTNTTRDGSNKTEYHKFLERNESVVINEHLNINDQLRALKYDKKFDIAKQNFKLEFILGEGEYGTVYKATATGIPGTKGPIKVAAKQVKNILDSNQWLTILDELKILSYLDTHFNLVNLVAANTENIETYELFLLLEYCPYGNLKKFLIDKRDKFKGSLSNQPGCLETEFNWNLLLTWSYSIAAGMDYLASKNIMHGDLAARNILIGENYSAKISDFGLSKMMYYNEDYKKTERRLIPLAWMAIEYLQTGEFNMMSDVWSFGVTLWEMFSLGNKPYGLVPYEQLKKNILEGERLEAPKNLELHPDGYNLFKQIIEPCWREEFKTRPTFAESMQNIATFLGEEGIQAYKKEEEEYLISKNELVRQNSNKQTNKPPPTGYVRLESIDKHDPKNCSPEARQYLTDLGESYSKIITTSNEHMKADPSPEPGYIELSTMLESGNLPKQGYVAVTMGHKLSQIPGDPPDPGYSRAIVDERGYTQLSSISTHSTPCTDSTQSPDKHKQSYVHVATTNSQL